MQVTRRNMVFLAIAVAGVLALWATAAREAVAPKGQAGGSAAAPAGELHAPDGLAEGRLPPNAIDSETIPDMVLAADANADAPLPYYRIGPDTYMLYGNIAEVDADNRGWNGNAGFVVTEEGVVVIDALGTPKLGQRFIATIRSVTDRPITHLIVTHNHPDHAYGAVAFRRAGDVTVIAHEGTLEYLNSTSLESSVAFRRSFIDADMEGFEAVRPDLLIGGEPLSLQHTLSLGGKRFAIYNAGKHHSYGDLVVHQMDDQILWISDLAFNHRTTFMGDGSSKDAVAAQTWLLENFPDVRLMVPGHGSAQTPPFPMVAETRAYMERLRADMAEAVEHGMGLQEAVESSDFSEWHGTRLYEENHSKNANFVYREMELELF